MASKAVDMESQPLLGNPATGFPAIPMPSKVAAAREWRHGWYHVFGDGSPQDVAACCLAFKFPCVAWGWNQNRGLQFSFWKELCRFVLLTAGVFFTLHISCCLMMMALCPQAMPPPDGPMDGPEGTMGPRDGDHMHHGSMHHGDHPYGDHDDAPPQLPEECVARVVPATLAIAAVFISLSVVIALFFARRRTAIRERFGIAGTKNEDVALTLCCAPCALAQETRTLMHEQVHEGTWYGALPGVHAPAAQQMA